MGVGGLGDEREERGDCKLGCHVWEGDVKVCCVRRWKVT